MTYWNMFFISTSLPLVYSFAMLCNLSSSYIINKYLKAIIFNNNTFPNKFYWNTVKSIVILDVIITRDSCLLFCTAVERTYRKRLQSLFLFFLKYNFSASISFCEWTLVQSLYFYIQQSIKLFEWCYRYYFKKRENIILIYRILNRHLKELFELYFWAYSLSKWNKIWFLGKL